jgi:hypothetical protein
VGLNSDSHLNDYCRKRKFFTSQLPFICKQGQVNFIFRLISSVRDSAKAK